MSQPKVLDCIALHFNNYRVFPRLFVGGYGLLVWHMAHWYEHLAVPTTEQTTFVSIMTAMLVPILKFYLDTGSFQSTGERV